MMKRGLFLAIAFALLLFGVTNARIPAVFWVCMIGSLVFDILSLMEGGGED